MKSKIKSKSNFIIIYDGDCPFCKGYVNLVSLNRTFNLVLLNARDRNELVCEMIDKGYDLDRGMIAIVENTIFYGPSAMKIISQMSNSNGGFINNIIIRIFKKEEVSVILYPILTFLRRVVLIILRRKKIHQK